MHYPVVTKNYAWLPHNVDPSIPAPPELADMPIQPLGDRQSFYENNIQGCVDHYEPRGQGTKCIKNERIRLAMSLRQPKSVYNYTKTGYTKIRAPQEVMDLLTDFWNANRYKNKTENWAPAYVRHDSILLVVKAFSLEMM